jgi:hypothetical protein
MVNRSAKKRLSRITRRALPETQKAFAEGKISARRADTLLYLEPKEQLAELNRILSAREDLTRRSQIAVQVIRKHLNRGVQPSLAALREDLRLALASSTIQTHAH